MKQLLIKEFKLCVHPTCYLFLPMAALMMLIPSYPLYVSFFYETLGLYFVFLIGNEKRDIIFSSLLPVTKKDMVKARTLLMVIFELAVLLLSVPFVLLRAKLGLATNAAGTDPGAAFFGLSLVQFALFNLIFLPGFYRTAYQAGKPFLLAAAVEFLFIALVEASMYIFPYCKNILDSMAAEDQLAQLPVLLAGIALYALLTVLACRRAENHFTKVDL